MQGSAACGKMFAAEIERKDDKMFAAEIQNVCKKMISSTFPEIFELLFRFQLKTVQ